MSTKLYVTIGTGLLVVGLALAFVLERWTISKHDATAIPGTSKLNDSRASILESQDALHADPAAKQAVSMLRAAAESAADSAGSAQANNNDFYGLLDAQLRNNVPPPAWFYADRDIYAEVAAKDRTANVSEVKCGEKVCRVIVQHENADARDRFSGGSSSAPKPLTGSLLAASSKPTESALLASTPQKSGSARNHSQLSRIPSAGSTTLYVYPTDNPTQSILYVTKAPSQDEIRYTFESKTGQ